MYERTNLLLCECTFTRFVKIKKNVFHIKKLINKVYQMFKTYFFV